MAYTQKVPHLERTVPSEPNDIVPIGTYNKTRSVWYATRCRCRRNWYDNLYPLAESQSPGVSALSKAYISNKKKIKHFTQRTKSRSRVQGSNNLCSIPPFPKFLPTRPNRLSSMVSNVGFPGLVVTFATLAWLLLL